MRPTQHHQDLGLVTDPPGAGPHPDPNLLLVRRPRGRGRGLRPDPALEVRFDPRLELAEQLLHRSIGRPEPVLLRQAGNLIEDVRAGQKRPGIPSPRTGPAEENVSALIDLDQLLLSMTQEMARDEPPSRAQRAKRIMEARRLLHRVDQESADPRWPSGIRRRKLHEIISAQSAPPGRD